MSIEQAIAAALTVAITENIEATTESPAAAAQAVIKTIGEGTDSLPGFDLVAREDKGDIKAGAVANGLKVSEEFDKLAAAFDDAEAEVDEEAQG